MFGIWRQKSRDFFDYFCYVPSHKNKMKTDFKKLTRYECVLISIIVLGLAIIGFEIFASLPNKTQGDITAAFDIFDIHEKVTEQYYQLASLVDIGDDVFNEFNLAFNQMFAIDEELLALSDGLERGYQLAVLGVKNFTDSDTALAFEPTGQVLGVSMEVKSCSHEVSDASLDFHYTFTRPTVSELKHLVSNFSQ
jgi:hypothetical protein